MQALIESEVNHIVESNKTIIVSNKDELCRATTCIKGIRGLIEKIKESFDPIVEKSHQSHKEAISQRDRYLKPLQSKEKEFKEAIVNFNKKMEQEQRERERLANELLAKHVEEHRQKLLQKSQETDDEWDKEALQEKAKEIVPIKVDTQKKVIEQEGLSICKTWKAKVIDINIIPHEYLIIEPNFSALNQYARENKNTKPMLGVEFYEESSAKVK